MNRKNRMISLLLLTAMLAACGEGAGSPLETTAGGADSDAPETTLSFSDAHASAKDALPEADFGGESFVITINNYTGCEDGFLAEELTGDVLNDAVFRRNSAVEERFNVKLDIITGNYLEIPKQVTASVTAGEDYYQLLNQHVNTAAQWVTGEILYDWYEIPHVDFSNPWWSPSNEADLTMNGRAFLAIGDYGLTTLGRTYTMYYDKVEAEAYELPDLYEMVYDGNWTLDTMLGYSKDTYRDLNGNGQRDTVEDFFGFTMAKGSNTNAFLWAFGGKIIEDGEIVLDVEKTADTLTRLIDICWNMDGTCYDTAYTNASGNANYIGVEKLAVGTTLFCVAMIDSGILYLRDSMHDYGILPFPKWDAEQKDYYTIVDPAFTAMAIPKTVADTERAGILAEALCAETYRAVIPHYYETALKQKGARDEESIAMMDYILTKRVYDFGLVYDGNKGFFKALSSLVASNNPNFASYHAANIGTVQAYYDELFALFENYGK